MGEHLPTYPPEPAAGMLRRAYNNFCPLSPVYLLAAALMLRLI